MDSLQHHFLIAMPSLKDTFFERSVIYICEHDAKGAMGLMINRPLGLEIDELLEQMDLKTDRTNRTNPIHAQVLIGGPVNTDRGFVLHSSQKGWANSLVINDQLMLTSSRDVLNAIGTHEAPTNFIVALGYAGWGKNQLEQEIADNTWLTIPATSELLFSVEHDQRWQQASRTLGFDLWQISSQTGHG